MSNREDIIGVIGAILSTIFAALGFLWSIGFLQLIFTFLTGAFTTYIVQHRLQIESEKRKIIRENALELRDEIYGPIFMELSTVLENVESVMGFEGYTISEKLKEIMTHYLFFTIREDLKRKLSELIDRIAKYGNIRRAAELMVQKNIRTEVSSRHQIDIETREDTPDITLRIGMIAIAYTNLMHILFRDINPREFVRLEAQKWGEGVIVEVGIREKRGYSVDEFELIYSNVKSTIEGAPLFREERKQRTLLIGELKAYIKEILPFINPE